MTSIQDSINPKFLLLDNSAKILWDTYLHIQEHQKSTTKHQFYYSLKTLQSITGLNRNSIIHGNQQLKCSGIIFCIQSHRKTNYYFLLEKKWKRTDEYSFIYELENNSKVRSPYLTGTPTVPKEVRSPYPTSTPTVPQSIDLSKELSKKLSLEQEDFSNLSDRIEKLDQEFVYYMNQPESKEKVLCLKRFVKSHPGVLDILLNNHPEFNTSVKIQL